MPANHQVIVAVVVTFNRRDLLERCIEALRHQSCRPDRILIIDNASTDGTGEWLLALSTEFPDLMCAVSLPMNGGGATGFAEGMKRGFELGADWVWMMDDDAEPLPDALEALMELTPAPEHIHGSLAVAGERTSWATTLLAPNRVVTEAAEIPAHAEVLSLPFLGFLIHRSLASRLGLPDAGYFIAADDIEYCLRAQKAGARLYIAGKSRIAHPPSTNHEISLLGRKINYLSLPPWKRYYDTRNRLLNARQYHGVKLWTEAVPGTLTRLVATLVREPRKLAQFWAVTTGMIDGLLGLKGIRHSFWRIPR